MKIKKSELKQIIQEELEAVLDEKSDRVNPYLTLHRQQRTSPRSRAIRGIADIPRDTAAAADTFVDDPSPRHASDVARAAIGFGKIPTKGQYDPSKMGAPKDWEGDREKADIRATVAHRSPEVAAAFKPEKEPRADKPAHDLKTGHDPRMRPVDRSDPSTWEEPPSESSRQTAISTRRKKGQSPLVDDSPEEYEKKLQARSIGFEEGLIKQMVQEELEAVIAERNR